jgi:hypothetical protein
MMHDSILNTSVLLLRQSRPMIVAAGFLPLPALLATDRSEIASLYLGMACAWLSTEMTRVGGMPTSRVAWCSMTLALMTAVFSITAFFIALGITVNVQSNLPFPIMAFLSAIPAIGLVPWLMIRLEQQYTVLILSALIVGTAKIGGCAIARIVYGPNFAVEGYISGDWTRAKLMISVFWILTSAISLGFLFAGFLRPPCPRPSD